MAGEQAGSTELGGLSPASLRLYGGSTAGQYGGNTVGQLGRLWLASRLEASVMPSQQAN